MNCGELLQQTSLGFDYLPFSRFEIKPFGPVYFGELTHFTGARRPFDGECVAFEMVQLEVGGDRPSMDNFSTALFYWR
jgi:hypothetical protein